MICVRWNATAALYKSWREPAPPIVALSLFGDRGAPLPKYGSDELQLPSSQSPPLLCARCSLLATSFWRHGLFSRWLSLHSLDKLINPRTLIRIERIFIQLSAYETLCRDICHIADEQLHYRIYNIDRMYSFMDFASSLNHAINRSLWTWKLCKFVTKPFV